MKKALSIIIFALFVEFLPAQVIMHMTVPLGSCVIIANDYYDLSDETRCWDPYYPEDGVLELDFLQQNRASYYFKVEKTGCKSIIGCFEVMLNSSFRIELPKGNKDEVLDSEAMLREGYKLWNDGFASKSRLRKAHKLMLKAARLGNVHAMCSLADSFFQGMGCAKNDKKAIYWYSTAEQFGSIHGTNGISGVKRYNGWR